MKEKKYIFISYIVSSMSKNITVYGDKCFCVEEGEKLTIEDIRGYIKCSETEIRPWVDDWATPCITNIQVLDKEIAEMLYNV